MKYRVYMEQDEDGVFVATARLCSVAFPRAERAAAADNIRDGIEG